MGPWVETVTRWTTCREGSSTQRTRRRWSSDSPTHMPRCARTVIGRFICLCPMAQQVDSPGGRLVRTPMMTGRKHVAEMGAK